MTSKRKVLKSANEHPECSICCEQFNPQKKFHCSSCQFDCCDECFKQYLLTSNQDPHCMNCKHAVPYDVFMNFTEKSWRFKTYKQHRETILWEREQSKLPATVGNLQRIHRFRKIDNEILELQRIIREHKKKIEELKEKRHQLRIATRDELVEEQVTEKSKNKFHWTFKCPTENCRGFLDSKYECVLCSHSFCKKCLIPINSEDNSDHECDPALVETIQEIKKSSKSCPTCGQFISKISGCDQMFCTDCGTAFSWKTGEKETGVIHNPHAFQFFQANPQQREIYENMRRNQQECRNEIPRLYTGEHEIAQTSLKNICTICQNIHNVLHFELRFLRNYLQHEDFNQDIRIRFLENEIDEKNFKKILHAREKKRNFLHQIYPILQSAYQDIFFTSLWGIHDNNQDVNMIRQIFDNMHAIRNETNQILKNITEEFNYSSIVSITDTFNVDNLSFPR